MKMKNCGVTLNQIIKRLEKLNRKYGNTCSVSEFKIDSKEFMLFKPYDINNIVLIKKGK